MLKLLIADDHALVRDALKTHIERQCSDASVVTAASVDDAMSTIAAVHAEPFSLIILDLWMPGMDGLHGLERVLKATQSPVAVMSGLAKPADVQAAMDVGAVGFLPKTIDGGVLLEVVRAFSNREPANAAAIRALAAAYPVDSSPVSAKGRPVSTLTRKEDDVVRHLLLGMSNKEIARCLGVEEVTVKLHVKNICRKLDARNRTHAALQAVRIGYVAAICPGEKCAAEQ
ncbi:response regulator transcription factor [Fodinicurvata sp. EGI_FJ10296]|uniref:response regulator transcription factor n=1 Tax=Fodinicurvata sp. EGI_FJ10296 TaxID=3231908 RepID=UPI003452DE37